FFDDKVAPLNISWSRKAGSCRATGVDLRGAHVVWPRPRPYREPPGAAFPARVSRPRPQPPTTTSTSSPERWAERGRRTRSGRLREGCGDRRWPEREAGEGFDRALSVTRRSRWNPGFTGPPCDGFALSR